MATSLLGDQSDGPLSGLLGLFKPTDYSAMYTGSLLKDPQTGQIDPAVDAAFRQRALGAAAEAFAQGGMPVPYKGGIPLLSTIGMAGGAASRAGDPLMAARTQAAQQALYGAQAQQMQAKIDLYKQYMGGAVNDLPGAGGGSTSATPGTPATGGKPLTPMNLAAQGGGGQVSPQQLYSFLTDNGASKNEATAITSGMMAESGGNPNQEHDKAILAARGLPPGYGLFGDNGTNLTAMRTYAGVGPNDPVPWQQQALFALQSLRPGGIEAKAGAQIASAQNPEQLTDAQLAWLRPKDWNSGGGNRDQRLASTTSILNSPPYAQTPAAQTAAAPADPNNPYATPVPGQPPPQGVFVPPGGKQAVPIQSGAAPAPGGNPPGLLNLPEVPKAGAAMAAPGVPPVGGPAPGPQSLLAQPPPGAPPLSPQAQAIMAGMNQPPGGSGQVAGPGAPSGPAPGPAGPNMVSGLPPITPAPPPPSPAPSSLLQMPPAAPAAAPPGPQPAPPATPAPPAPQAPPGPPGGAAGQPAPPPQLPGPAGQVPGAPTADEVRRAQRFAVGATLLGEQVPPWVAQIAGFPIARATELAKPYDTRSGASHTIPGVGTTYNPGAPYEKIGPDGQPHRYIMYPSQTGGPPQEIDLGQSGYAPGTTKAQQVQAEMGVGVGIPGEPIRAGILTPEQGAVDPGKPVPSPDNATRSYQTNIPPITAQARTPDLNTYNKAQPEWIKETGELSDAGVAAQRAEANLNLITQAYKSIQTGTWAQQTAEVKGMWQALTQTLGISPPQNVADLAAVQTALHANYKQTLAALSSANKRFTGNEFKINSDAGEAAGSQPEANLNLLSSDLGQVRQIQALAQDWNHAQTIVGTDGSRWVNPDSFKTQWVHDNPIDGFIKSARADIGQLKGTMPANAPQGAVPTGRTYKGAPVYNIPDPNAPGGFRQWTP